MKRKIKSTILTIMFSIICIGLMIIPSEAKDIGNKSTVSIAVRRTDSYDIHLSGKADGTPDDTFCVQYGAHVNTGNVYTVKNRIEIDGLDSVVYEGNTDKVVREVKDNINNGIMAWILAQEDTGSSHSSAIGKYYSNKQKAIYGFFGTWKKANGLTTYRSNSGGYSYSNWITKGKEYANNYKKDDKASIEDKTDKAKIVNEAYTYNNEQYIKVGPFNWTYTGNLEEVNVYNQDGNKIDAKIAKYSGDKLKVLDDNTKITSEKAFYVLVKADGKTTTIKLDGTVSVVKEKYKATIWTLSHGKWKKQNIITTKTDKSEEKDTDNVETEPVDVPVYIDLSGYVWTEAVYGKKVDMNELYKDNNSDLYDTAVDGIEVYLKDKDGNIVKDKDGNECKATTKELGIYDEIEGGEYKFKNVDMLKLDEYYVEFNYNGLTYTSIAAHTDKNNGSKATEIPELRTTINNQFAQITGQTDVNALDSTIQATTKQTPYSLKGAYEQQQGTEIRYVNLGLRTREQPDFGLAKDLDSVKIAVNGYHHIYKYNQKQMEQSETVTENGFNIGVKFAINNGGSYKRAIYKADADYVTEDKSKELKMSLTYKIALRNEAENLKAQINSIIEYYDARYESIKAGTGLDDKGQITGEFTTPTSEAYNDKYKKAVIDTNGIQVESGKVNYIYVQFELSREAVAALLNDNSESEEVLLKNVAEINSYTTLDENGNVYAAIDKDSTPGNAVPGDTSTYEDDADSAPTLKLEIADARRMTGKVFLDATSGELKIGEVRQGSGAYEDGEIGIAGIEVKLTENTGSGKEYLATTNENGDFEISGFIPGSYTLTYTWGDTTYTVQNYKGTVYDNSRDQSENWYKNDVDTRKTDAIDNWETRQAIDNEMKTITNKTQTTITKMNSTTPTMGIGVEYETTYTASAGDRYEYLIKNIDFGIVERARQNLEMTKRVKTMKVTLANSQVIVNFEIDEDGKLIGEHDHIAYMGPSDVEPKNGFVKLELDNELIQGATIEVGYEIKATNNSELEYTSENFYKYGIIEGDAVTIIPSAVIDYLDKDWSFNSSENIDWEVKSLEEVKELLNEEVYESEETQINDKTILYTEKLLTPLQPKQSAQVMLKVSKILSTTDEINLDNETELVKMDKNGGSKPQSIPGNYIPGTGSTESDDSMAEEVIVTPSTGANLAFVLPITVGLVALAILGAGVILIKKKVLKK